MARRTPAMLAFGPLIQILGLVVLVMGLGVVVLGLTSSSDGPPTCGEEIMRPDDLCRTEFAGDINVVGYAEMKRREEETPRNSFILGGWTTCIGATLVIGGRALRGRWIFQRGWLG